MHRWIVLLCSLCWCNAFCQKGGGAEQYYYSHQPAGGAVQPSVWYLSPKGWYSAVRYNYEDVQTLSALAGKKWTGKSGKHSITPLVGVLYGNSRGGTIQIIGEVGWGSLSITTEPQYVMAFTGKQDNFYYNWSEVSIDLSRRLFAGGAVQHTLSYKRQSIVEPGIFMGLSFDSFEIPLYIFKGANEQPFFVAGLSWTWSK